MFCKLRLIKIPFFVFNVLTAFSHVANNKRGRPRNRNYISDSTDSNGTRYSNGNNRANRGEQLKTVLVTGLNRQTVPGTLRDYFLRFGPVAKAALNLDDNEERTGAATISFR